MNRSTDPLPIVLAIFVLLALAFSVTIPLGESPDEVSHISYVQALVQTGRLPAPEGNAIGEAHQPPLYYLLLAVVSAWNRTPLPVQANPEFSPADPETPNILLHTRVEAWPYAPGAWAWHLQRAVSALLGAVTVWATYRLALLFFRGARAPALASAACVAFMPYFLVLHAVVNNDTLTITLSTLTVLCLAEMRRAPRLRDGIWLGILLGLGALTKLTGLLLWGVAGAALLWLVWRDRERRAAWLRVGAAAFAVALVCFLPWWVYGAQAYGDPFAWARFRQVNPRGDAITWADLELYVERMGWAFWGKFGGASQILLPDAIYCLLAGVVLLSLIGWLVWATRFLHIISPQVARSSERPQVPTGEGEGREGWFKKSRGVTIDIELAALFLLVAIVVWAAHFRLWMFTLGMDQARQVFAALPPLMILFVAGVLYLAGGRRTPALVIGGGMGLIALYTLAYSNVIYAPPLRDLTALPPLGHASAAADFGGQIRIADYCILVQERCAEGARPVRAAAGDTIAVRVYWQALRAPDESDWLLLQLARAEGGAGQREAVPTNGRVTTDRWLAGQTYVSTHRLEVPPDLEAGQYRLTLGLHPEGRFDWLPVRGGDALTLGEVEVR